MSIPPHLIAWKSTDAGCLYVISRCVGVNQLSFRSTEVASCDSCKTSTLSCRPLTCLRETVDSMPAVPGPPYWSVWAVATHRPSGELDSVDQIVAASLQPDAKEHSRTVVDHIAMRITGRPLLFCLLIGSPSAVLAEDIPLTHTITLIRHEVKPLDSLLPLAFPSPQKFLSSPLIP